MVRVIDVYPYRVAAEGVAFLLLRRVQGVVYAGQWRMVGGKIGADETAWAAALRELAEETGCTPVRFWAVPSVNAFYEWQHDRVNLIPAFAAEVDTDPVLDDEHDAYEWLPAGAAAERLVWPEQQRLLALVERTLARGVPPELVVPSTGR